MTRRRSDDLSPLGDGTNVVPMAHRRAILGGNDRLLQPRRITGPQPLPIPTPWVAPIAEWTLNLRAAGRSENTIATRADHMRRTARALPDGPWVITGQQLVAWAGRQTWSREGRRNVYATLRGFYKWAIVASYVDRSPADHLPSVRAEEPRPRPAPENVYRAALAAADDRGQLILRLAAEAGLRRAEIAVIHGRRDMLEDLDGWTLTVHGKGGKDRDVPLPPYLASTILLRAGKAWLFPGDYQGHLSPRWVGKLATRVMPDEWTLHTLRHRFASVSYEIDRDLMALRDVLGHTSVATTQRYIKTRDDAKRRIVASVSQYQGSTRHAA